MASFRRRHADGAAGAWFVDHSCIDCGACRWIAPQTFGEAEDHARVAAQPAGAHEERRARMALLACPTGSIGSAQGVELGPLKDAFPDPIEPPVYHLGYHARASYGAASYLILRPEGNLMIDSPRWSRPLVARLEALGGVRTLFLTHQDDVAEHQKIASHFGAVRILHAADLSADTRSVERVLEGTEPIVLDPEVTLIPTPGHTEGSTCLLFRQRFLFSGDHLAHRPDLGHPAAFRSACWYSWPELRRSMARLTAEFSFEWILPGHGYPCHFPAAEMKDKMRACLDWMR